MARKIKILVDAYGVDRKEIHALLFSAVEKACGAVIDSGYETGRSFFGMWSTWFSISSESHTNENRKYLQELLKNIYDESLLGIRGFRTIWEGDRHQKVIDEAVLSSKRFGKGSFNLGTEYFKHLQKQDDEK